MKLLTNFYQLRNRILREILRFPVWQVQSELVYKAELEKHISNLPALSAQDSAIVDVLRSEGICFTSLESLALPSTPLVLNAVKNLLPQMPKPSSSKTKDYVLHASTTQIMAFPELFFWGLEERLLEIAENYIGLPVAYHGVYFRRDIANNVKKKSRLWHLDMEDRRLFKIIVYLKDIGDDDGPFQYIPKHLTSFLSSKVKYNYGYIPDSKVQSVLPESNWKSCLGPAGTVIFVDTGNVFHRGKIPLRSDRLSLFFDYTSRRPKHPFYCKSSLSREELLVLAKKLSEREREYIFWRKRH